MKDSKKAQILLWVRTHKDISYFIHHYGWATGLRLTILQGEKWPQVIKFNNLFWTYDMNVTTSCGESTVLNVLPLCHLWYWLDVHPKRKHQIDIKFMSTQELLPSGKMDALWVFSKTCCWTWKKVAHIFQMTFSNKFSSTKISICSFKFQWNLFLRVQLIISPHQLK